MGNSGGGNRLPPLQSPPKPPPVVAINPNDMNPGQILLTSVDNVVNKKAANINPSVFRTQGTIRNAPAGFV